MKARQIFVFDTIVDGGSATDMQLYVHAEEWHLKHFPIGSRVRVSVLPPLSPPKPRKKAKR